MMIRKLFLVTSLLAISLFSQSYAQNSFRGWQVFTSFKEVRGVDFQSNQIWAASTGGLFTFDISNPSAARTFTNLDGLRSTQLSSVFVDNSGSVWSGSLEGAVSIYLQGSDSWRYITDIQTSNETSKRINHMFQYGNFLFMATEFSVIKFDVNFFQFVDQPYIYLGPLIAVKPPVYKLLVVNDTIWAATKYGIAFANIHNYLPIQSNWANYTTANSVMKHNQTSTVAYFGGKVYFGTDSGMVFYENNTLSRYEPLVGGQPLARPIIDIIVSGNSMYIASYRENPEIYRVDGSNLNEAQAITGGFAVNSLETDNNSNLYIASPSYGVLKNNLGTRILPDGPNSNLFVYVESDRNQNVWGTSGGSNEGIYRYNGSNWKNYTTDVYPWMKGNDYRQLYASSNTGIVWASGFGEGLLRIEGDSVFLYDAYNSCLEGFGGPDFVLVEGVKEDHNGNLWVMNRATEFPIINFSASPCQKYRSPAYPINGHNDILFLGIDNYNTKWMTIAPGGDDGKYVGYLNETVPTTAYIDASTLGADMQFINDIIVDKNGEVWVATDNGIAILSDPYEVIRSPNTNNPGFVKMRIIANGISTPLTENCKRIRVDALNNKWVATLSNGLLYLSPDGSTILAQINTSNSYLLENSVGSIATDLKGGKVYFGTTKGLNSYQTVAVEPLADCDRITAGPNPFLIPSETLLRIDGLVEGSTVKILSISGTLVAEFESPGGRIANWDGRDRNGNLVATGIYIIAGFNEDASKVCTGKVAVVRK